MTAARPVSRKLTGRQVRDLLAAAGAAPDPEVSQLVHVDARRLPDGGELLVFENGGGQLYESRAALLAMLESPAVPKPASDLLPLGQGFVARAAELALELATQAEGLDGTEPSLDEVDRLVRRLGAAAFLRPDQFQRLVAYVGEAVRATTAGVWLAVPAADGKTWEPWIVEPDGRRHPVSGLVFKELREWNRGSSLRAAIAGRLGPRSPRL